MSLYKKAGLVQIPSGYKADKLYSVVPNNGDGDFDFTRASTATRVNKDGLIETVATGTPRLDYPLLDGVVQDNPVLLLEPERRNLITYSEDFSNGSWTKINANITPNSIISPDGSQNADTKTTTSSVSETFFSSGSSMTTATCSLFVKKSTHKYFGITINGTNDFNSRYQGVFDLNSGSVFQENNSTTPLTNRSSKIETYGNGWYRISITATFAINSNAFVVLQQSNNVPAIASENLAWNNSSIGSTFIWGAQLEAGSYPTSYIKTQGETNGVTRSADICNGAGNSTVFNDSEGVIYVETQPFIDGDFTNLYISLSDNTGGSNFITIQHRNSGQLRVYAGNFTTIIYLLNIDMSENLKIALQYENITDFKLYVNGISYPIYSTPTNSAFVGLSTFDFKLKGSASGYWLGQVKEAKYFNTALTDAELIQLTS